MQKYNTGDLVYHSGLGAGIISRIQTITLSGTSQSYYVVELVGENTLMIPIGTPGENRLHSLISAKSIGEVLLAEPQEMDDDFRARQRDIEEKIQSGDQRQSAEVLRDLQWRVFNGHLTGSDKKLFNVVRKRLALILSAQGEMNVDEASSVLDTLLDKVMHDWKAALPEAPTL